MTKKLIKALIETVIDSEIPSQDMKKLRVFDFDDTIAKTNSRVGVRKPDGTRLSLTAGEYAVYSRQPGDQFDYDDFEKLVEPQEIRWITSILRKVINRRGVDAAVILTARGSKEPVELFFKEFDIPRIPIVALGDSHPDTKAFWILYVIKKFGYDVVEFFDDSPKNIAAVNAIQKRAPRTRIITRLIQHKTPKV